MKKKLNLTDIKEFPAFLYNKNIPMSEIEIFGCVRVTQSISVVSFRHNSYNTLGINGEVGYQYLKDFEDNFKEWEIKE